MKKRYLFLLAAIFYVTTVTGVSAVMSTMWQNVNLPSFSGIETGDQQTKEIDSLQHFQTFLAQDNITKGGRAISVRTLSDKDSAWISAPKGSIVAWTDSKANGNSKAGKYRLQVRATKSTLATVKFSGTWYLDDRGLK